MEKVEGSNPFARSNQDARNAVQSGGAERRRSGGLRDEKSARAVAPELFHQGEHFPSEVKKWTKAKKPSGCSGSPRF